MNWDEWRGSLDGRPSMFIKRLMRIPIWRRNGKTLSLRLDLHKFIRPDDIDCFHTHPAYAVRVILRTGYVEQLEDGTYRCWRPLDIGIVTPRLSHRVHLVLNNIASYSLWLRAPVTAKIDLRGKGWPA